MKVNKSDKTKKDVTRQCGLEEALDLTGFGKYNVAMLVSCCLLMLGMYLDMLGFSVPLPAAACELNLTTSQQGILSAIPLIGVMISSYAWGLCADNMGRRKTLLISMPVGIFMNIVTSFAPSFASLVAFKFLSACFLSSANAASFVLMGESVSRRYRCRCMFVMASATMCSQFVTAGTALPVFGLNFQPYIPLIGIEYKPWRLLVLFISLPGLVGTLIVAFLYESPKFLLSKGHNERALEVLKRIYSINNSSKENCFNVENIYLDDCVPASSPDVKDAETILIRKMWNQTVPLFKPPLLKNSCIIYYLLLCAFMTSTGYSVWIPTMINAYFNGEDNTGKSLCEVASTAAKPKNITRIDCDSAISTLTLYAVMLYSGLAAVLNVMMLLIVKPLGKKGSTLLVFVICILCGIFLVFVRIPTLSIALFFTFLYIAIVLGNANTYLVELNPTHLRGMATCLSVVVARGFGFISVQLIATFLENHCTPLLTGYIVLVVSGFFVAFLLPADVKKSTDMDKS